MKQNASPKLKAKMHEAKINYLNILFDNIEIKKKQKKSIKDLYQASMKQKKLKQYKDQMYMTGGL